MPVPRGPISSRGLFRLQSVNFPSSQPFLAPDCQVNKVLIARGVNGWYKEVVVVVEILNLCVLDYVVPVFPLASRLEVKDKLEDQSL